MVRILKLGFKETGILIINYSLCSPYYVTRTPTNGSAVLLSRVSVCIMSPVYCNVIQREFWSRDMDVYLTHIRIGKILTQFYANFSRQEHQIDVLHVSFNS